MKEQEVTKSVWGKKEEFQSLAAPPPEGALMLRLVEQVLAVQLSPDLGTE